MYTQDNHAVKVCSISFPTGATINAQALDVQLESM